MPDHIAVPSAATFVSAMAAETSVLAIKSFGDLIAQAYEIARANNPKVTDNALRNVSGDWYEWLIAIGALEFLIQQAANNNASKAFVTLPNVKSFACERLYVKVISDLISDLRDKTDKSANVSLITSNPDFVILNTQDIEVPQLQFPITYDQLILIDAYYTKFVEKCDFADIHGYASVKTSLRPDRRLQLSHEGSLMKALYRHIQTRRWQIDAQGIKYYAISKEFNNADAKGLRTVATHSILSVGSTPEAAVDRVFKVNSGQELSDFLQFVLA